MVVKTYHHTSFFRTSYTNVSYIIIAMPGILQPGPFGGSTSPKDIPFGWDQGFSSTKLGSASQWVSGYWMLMGVSRKWLVGIHLHQLSLSISIPHSLVGTTFFAGEHSQLLVYACWCLWSRQDAYRWRVEWGAKDGRGLVCCFKGWVIPWSPKDRFC